MNLKKFIISFSFLIISSCSLTDSFDIFSDNKFYYKSGYERVQLDSESKRVKNIHPIKINPANIEGALNLVLVKFGKTAEPLFSENKVYKFSVAISEALSEANKNQDIVFTVEDWYKRKYLKENRVTSGRIFYNNSGLNIIFGSILRKGNMNETDPMVKAGKNPDLVRDPFLPGSRFESVKNPFLLTAVPNSGVFRPRLAKNRIDWLVFSIKALQPRGRMSNQQKQVAASSRIEYQNLQSEIQKLKGELNQVKRSQNSNQYYDYRSQNYRNNNYQTPYQRYNNVPPNYGYNYPRAYRPGNTNYGNNNYKTKFEELKILRERGLISQEEFKQRIKKLKR
mgnify:CR=1 FL=1